MTSSILRLDRVLTGLCLYTACLLLATISCLGLWQVIARFVFSQPSTWTEESMRRLLIWMVMLGVVAAFEFEVGARVFQQHPPAQQVLHPRRDRQRIMDRGENGAPLVQMGLHQQAEGGPPPGVQRGERLVQQDEPRAGGQRARIRLASRGWMVGAVNTLKASAMKGRGVRCPRSCAGWTKGRPGPGKAGSN